MRDITAHFHRILRLSPAVLGCVAALLVAVSATSAAAESAPKSTSGYERGFFLRSPEHPFSMHTSMMGQMYLNAAATEGTIDQPDSLTLNTRRLRLKLKGNAFSENITYVLVAEFRATTKLVDAYLDWKMLPGTLELRLGYHKKPFARENLTSSSKQSFVDHTLLSGSPHYGRDVGLSLHNNFFKQERFAWMLGIFNGTGIKDDGGALQRMEPLLTGRAEVRLGPIKGYSQSDLRGGDLRFAAAISGETELDQDDDDDAYSALGIDYIAKLHGVAFDGAVALRWHQDGETAYDFAGGDPDIDVYQRLTYTFADWIQPGVRWAQTRGPAKNDDVQEVSGNMSFYFHGHSLKWQTDLAAFVHETPGPEKTRYRLRSLLQIAF